MSFAVRHPAVRNLWFNFNDCHWTYDLKLRTVFDDKLEAQEWAKLPMDGGIICCVD